MAQTTRIGGTNYSLKQGKALAGGTVYTIKQGKTRIDGTVYTIKMATDCTLTISGGSTQVGFSTYKRYGYLTYMYTSYTSGTLVVSYGDTVTINLGAASGNGSYMTVTLNGTKVASGSSDRTSLIYTYTPQTNAKIIFKENDVTMSFSVTITEGGSSGSVSI